MRLLLLWNDSGDVVDTTLDQFLDANADGIDGTEAAEIRASLAAGEMIHGGGGASPSWTLGAPMAVAELVSRQDAA
jgi:hypothetical protein